jgi:transcriptional regulator with XRE-family HTH domain
MTITRKSIHQQLGEFLRQRREACKPEYFGLAAERRRTPGLRREEVAEMAGISTDWYARLEQGRESQPSRQTMLALAQTLRLTDAEQKHLFRLGNGKGYGEFKKEVVPTNLANLVHGLTTPAYITGARKDMVCWNAAAVDLFRDFGDLPDEERNTLYQMFTEPRLKSLFVDWKSEARSMLEGFRADYDLWAHTPEFAGLVATLNQKSPEFRRWWRLHAVQTRTTGVKHMSHARLGSIRVRYSTFQCEEAPHLTLILYTMA